MHRFRTAISVWGLLISSIGSAQQSQPSPFQPAVGPPLVELSPQSVESHEYLRSYVRRVARARIGSKHTLVIENTISTTIPADSHVRNVVNYTEIDRGTVIVLPPEHGIAPPSEPPPGG